MKQSRSKTGRFTGYSPYELYTIGTELYKKAKDKLKDRGDKMHADWFDNFEQFNARLVQARNEGQKAGVKFVKDLVADMEYAVSRKSAQASAKAYREWVSSLPSDGEFVKAHGRTIQSWEFRQGIGTSSRARGFYDLLSDEYYAFKRMGYTGKQARSEVSKKFFAAFYVDK